MSVVSTSEEIVTLEEFAAFRDRVVKVRAQMESLGRGAQQRASYACKVSASRISGVLNARYYDLPALEELELWAEAQMSARYNVEVR